MDDMDKTRRTQAMARIIGPYLVIMATALLVRRDTLPTILDGFMEAPSLMLVTAVFTVMIGLVIIAAHHHWNSPSAGLISFVGIAATAKGAWLMIAPEFGAAFTTGVLVTTPVLVGAAGFALLLGSWLSAAGWSSRQT